MKRQTIFPLMLTFSLLLPVGCGDHDHDHANHHHSSGSCSDVENLDTYVDGLEKETAAGHYTVRIKSLSPAPPSKGELTMQWEIVDKDGMAVSDANLMVRPFMPAHGHGSSPEDNPGTFEDGAYNVGPLTLQMAGHWEFRVSVEGSLQDSAVFSFCVDG